MATQAPHPTACETLAFSGRNSHCLQTPPGGIRQCGFGHCPLPREISCTISICSLTINEENTLSPLAFRHHAFHLIQPAICAGRPILDDITADLAGSTATAGLGGTTLDGTGVDEASRRGLAFSLGFRGVHGFGGGGHHKAM